jgi:hypothetical protein
MDMAGSSGIPEKFRKEFMTNLRGVKIDSTKGTRVLDVKLFQDVISKVLSNKDFMTAMSKEIVKEYVIK